MKAKSARRVARESYVVRQMVSDPGAAVQCQVTIAAVKAYMGGFPEFTLDVRAVGRDLTRVAEAADRVYRARFEALRRFMIEQKEAAEREALDKQLMRKAEQKDKA